MIPDMRGLAILTMLGLALVAPPARAQSQADALAARSRQGSEAMNAGRFDEAAAIYRELVAALPNEAGLHMNLGMALAMGGHEADAVAPLERAVRLQPSLLPAQLFLGSTFLSLGNPKAAIAPLRRVVTAKPADPSAWSLLAQAYNGIVQATLATFEESAGEDDWRTLLLADALRDDGRLGPAFSAYRRVLDKLKPTRAAHNGIATIYEQTGHGDWAAVQRGRAAKVVLDCQAQAAECAFAKARYTQVIADTARRTDPASRYWRIRAAAALTRAAFAKLEALPDSRERRVMRAELARSRGQHVESVAELKAALTFSPDEPSLLAELALSHHLARDYEQAITIERTLLERAPGDASMLALYGQSLLELQRVDEAIPALQRALALAPGDTAARAALGRAFVQKGEMAQAIPLLEPALASDEEGTLHFQLARAYQATGQADKAKPLLEKYQSLQQARRERDAASESTIVGPDEK
jgi:predicted Zn-dependent protease